MITVTISWNELTELPDPAFIQMYILSRLRDAGMPIKGLFLFQGVERGTLTEEMDITDRAMAYTWSE